MEDQEDIENQRQLLSTYRQTLAFQRRQLAQQGSAHATTGLLFGIAEAQENIRQIKQALRNMGIEVQDFSTDDLNVPTTLSGDTQQGNSIASVYERFWANIEEIHIMVRIGDIDNRELFNKKLQELNIFSIRNSLHIDKKDLSLANLYLKTLYELKQLINERGTSQEKEVVIITSELSPESFPSDIKIANLVIELENLHNTIYENVKTIINSPQIKGNKIISNAITDTDRFQLNSSPIEEHVARQGDGLGRNSSNTGSTARFTQGFRHLKKVVEDIFRSPATFERLRRSAASEKSPSLTAKEINTSNVGHFSKPNLTRIVASKPTYCIRCGYSVDPYESIDLGYTCEHCNAIYQPFAISPTCRQCTKCQSFTPDCAKYCGYCGSEL